MGTCRQATSRGPGVARGGIRGSRHGRRGTCDYHRARLAVELKVGRREGLPRDCVINCDWLVTLPKADLLERAGTLSASKLHALDDALRFALGLDA